MSEETYGSAAEALADAMPPPPTKTRCPKCNATLSPCDVCGKPSQCGEVWCDKHVLGDGWGAHTESTSAALARVTAERDGYRAYIDEIKAELAEAISVRNALAGQLSEGMRGGMWIVARDGGRDCIRCWHEIRRGEAYELLPGVDHLRHIHCPTTKD